MRATKKSSPTDLRALQHLTIVEWEYKCQQHPTIPADDLLKPEFSDKTESELTNCILRWIELHDGYAVHLGAPLRDREPVSRWTRYSATASIHAIYRGNHLSIDVAIGHDSISDEQKQAGWQVRRAGGLYFVARTFQDFYDWFTTYVLAVPASSRSLYHQCHPIPRLATPDLNPYLHP